MPAPSIAKSYSRSMGLNRDDELQQQEGVPSSTQANMPGAFAPLPRVQQSQGSPSSIDLHPVSSYTRENVHDESTSPKEHHSMRQSFSKRFSGSSKALSSFAGLARRNSKRRGESSPSGSNPTSPVLTENPETTPTIRAVPGSAGSPGVSDIYYNNRTLDPGVNPADIQNTHTIANSTQRLANMNLASGNVGLGLGLQEADLEDEEYQDSREVLDTDVPARGTHVQQHKQTHLAHTNNNIHTQPPQQQQQQQQRPRVVIPSSPKSPAQAIPTVSPVSLSGSPVSPVSPPLPKLVERKPVSKPQPVHAPPEVPKTAEEWKEKGAATAIKTEVAPSGESTTKVVRKGVNDFSFGRPLGEGSYSTVRAAIDRHTLREYAIKVLDKRHIIKEKKVKYVNIEKNTLNRLGDHPGIVRLYYTFQDETSLYFVLDYAANGELLSLIKRTTSLNEECTKYYGAQLLDAIDYMHNKGVVHRDLKPENILLDDKMRIKVTDFGTAKLMEPLKDADGNVTEKYPEDVKAHSFVGTAEYVSPELLTDKATGKSSDFWAFGCILYQMLAGRPPFKAGNEYQTFQKIVKCQMSYPPGFPYVARDLIKRLLVINPRQRLKMGQIKSHPFFEGIDWNDRKAIWKGAHPKLQPYRPSAKSSNPMVAARQTTLPPHVPSTQVQPMAPRQIPNYKALQQQHRARQEAQSKQSAHAAAAALAMKPSAPFTRKDNDLSPTSSASTSTTVSKKNGTLHLQTKVSGTALRRTSQAGTSTERLQSSAEKPLPSPTAATALAGGAMASRQFRSSVSGPTTPTTSVNPALVAATLATPPPQAPSVEPPVPPQEQVNGQKQQAVEEPVETSTESEEEPEALHATELLGRIPRTTLDNPPMLPAASNLDAEFAGLMIAHDERILKVGNVFCTATNKKEDDEDNKDHSRLSKFFTGLKKKRRGLIITTSCRALLLSVDDRRIRVEIDLMSPYVAIRDYPARKNGPGGFAMEVQQRVYFIEDANGSADWIRAISKAAEYGEFREVVAAQRDASIANAAAASAITHNTGSSDPGYAAAAAAAARTGPSSPNLNNMSIPFGSPTNAAQPGPPHFDYVGHSNAMYSSLHQHSIPNAYGSFSYKLQEAPAAPKPPVTTSTSKFLARNEERKQLRRLGHRQPS